MSTRKTKTAGINRMPIRIVPYQPWTPWPDKPPEGFTSVVISREELKRRISSGLYPDCDILDKGKKK